MQPVCWVNLSANFGDPYKVYTIDLRAAMYAGFHPEGSDPVKLEAECKKLIHHFRPELDNRLYVASINMRGGLWVEMVAVHPTFPRVSQFSMSDVERLERCRVCGRPLSSCYKIDSPSWSVAVGERVYEVCSEGCVGLAKTQEAWPETMPDRVIEGS